MPTAEELRAGLSAIANDWRQLSMLWHGYFTVLILVLISGLRPTVRTCGLLLALPLLSVSVLAWIHNNPFNGASFALMGILLPGIAAYRGREEVRVSPRWLTVSGAFMVGFGWLYPHFLNNPAPAAYLYSAPTGLIPCPTLSIVIGFTLMLGGLRSRPWCLVLTMAGLFYGAFGVGWLGVKIDGVLCLGALATAYAAFSPRLMGDGHGATAR